MSSPAKIAANQANAKKSTGPRTESGKTASSRNHTSHGLCSREFVVEPGEEAEFETFMLDLRNAVRPDGALECDLFTQLAHASWTLRRCRRAEVHLQSSELAGGLDPLRTAECDARLRTLDTYARRAERTYHKALTELKRLQSTRVFRRDAQKQPCFAEEHSALPLARSEALVHPRMQMGKVLARSEEARLMKELDSIALSFDHFDPMPRRSEHSNPIPATEATAG